MKGAWGWVVDLAVVIGVFVLLGLKSAPPEALLPLLTLIVGARFGKGNGLSGVGALLGRDVDNPSGPWLRHPRGKPRGRHGSVTDQRDRPDPPPLK